MEGYACNERDAVGAACTPGLEGPFADDVSQAVTIDTPHDGTSLALLGPSPSASLQCITSSGFSQGEMVPGSATLTALASRSIPASSEMISMVSYRPGSSAGDCIVNYASQDLKTLFPEDLNVLSQGNPVPTPPPPAAACTRGRAAGRN